MMSLPTASVLPSTLTGAEAVAPANYLSSCRVVVARLIGTVVDAISEVVILAEAAHVRGSAA